MTHYSSDIKKHTEKRRVPALVLLCMMVYFVSYLARLSYSAVMVEMIAEEGYSKALVAIPLTGLSVTYGCGQLISGFLGDKLSPEKMIFSGLIVSAVMNLALPFADSIPLMTVIWCINGFAQAMMWPPIVKILTGHLSQYEYQKNVVYIGYGSSLGTIVIYLLAPLAITLSGWKTVFIFAALFAAVMAVVWRLTVYKAEGVLDCRKDAPKNTAPGGEHFSRFAIVLLAIIVASVAMQGILRDGISAWMPTYITEVFKVDSTVSILTGIALPIFSMFIMWFSAFIYRKFIKNESLCAALFFGLCALSAGVLSLASSASAVLSVVMLMVANAATHGVNMMYTTMVVPNFARYGKTAFITGLINSATYVGSAVSMYGVAVITDAFGWSGTMISWLIVSVVGIVIALMSVKPLVKLKKLNKEG